MVKDIFGNVGFDKKTEKKKGNLFISAFSHSNTLFRETQRDAEANLPIRLLLVTLKFARKPCFSPLI